MSKTFAKFAVRVIDANARSWTAEVRNTRGVTWAAAYAKDADGQPTRDEILADWDEDTRGGKQRSVNWTRF